MQTWETDRERVTQHPEWSWLPRGPWAICVRPDRSGDLALTGDCGCIPGPTKAALGRGLQAELTEHLGYEKGAAAASLFAYSRNGTTSRVTSSKVGDFVLAQPRTGTGRSSHGCSEGLTPARWLDEMIVSLNAGGMTIRDIQHHLANTIGTELSHETISNITDEIGEEILAWQRRTLARCTR